jgi:hypothetical protein
VGFRSQRPDAHEGGKQKWPRPPSGLLVWTKRSCPPMPAAGCRSAARAVMRAPSTGSLLLVQTSCPAMLLSSCRTVAAGERETAAPGRFRERTPCGVSCSAAVQQARSSACRGSTRMHAASDQHEWRARLLSPNLERAAAAVRTIAFPVSPARGGRSPWRLSTRPLGTQPASRRTCPLAKSTAFIRTLAINGKQQLACRGGGFDDRVGSVPAAERRPRAAPNGTAPWLVRLSTGAR